MAAKKRVLGEGGTRPPGGLLDFPPATAHPNPKQPARRQGPTGRQVCSAGEEAEVATPSARRPQVTGPRLRALRTPETALRSTVHVSSSKPPITGTRSQSGNDMGSCSTKEVPSDPILPRVGLLRERGRRRKKLNRQHEALPRRG